MMGEFNMGRLAEENRQMHRHMRQNSSAATPLQRNFIFFGGDGSNGNDDGDVRSNRSRCIEF